jgi:hypothetical protein
MNARVLSRWCVILAVIAIFSQALGWVLLSYPPLFAPHNVLSLALMAVPPVAFLVCGALALALSPPFARMRWAFLFTGVTAGPVFTLGMDQFAIDLLPDFIGYIVFVWAANGLLGVHPRVGTVRNLALALNFLAIPACVQWRVMTSKVGNVTYFMSPLFPLDALVAVLDLIMVWTLCGMVADLARQAGATRTEHSALFRRKLYVGLRLLMAAGAFTVLANAELLVPAVIAGLVLGLIMIGLMMGLMSQAQQVCALTPVSVEVGSGLPAEPAPRQRPSPIARGFALGGIVLPVVLFAGAVWYCVDWRNARKAAADQENRPQFVGNDERKYEETAKAFLADIRAGRLDAAYESTSAGFKKRMSRQAFFDLVDKYPAVKRPPDARIGMHSGESGPWSTSDQYLFHNRACFQEGATFADKASFDCTITVVRDDRIFHYRPRPPCVDDFTLKEWDASPSAGPGGGRFPPPPR